MDKVTIQTDAQRDLLDALAGMEGKFQTAGVAITRAEVQNILALIDAIDSWPKLRVFLKKLALLLIKCMIAVLRRL